MVIKKIYTVSKIHILRFTFVIMNDWKSSFRFTVTAECRAPKNKLPMKISNVRFIVIKKPQSLNVLAVLFLLLIEIAGLARINYYEKKKSFQPKSFWRPYYHERPSKIINRGIYHDKPGWFYF